MHEMAQRRGEFCGVVSLVRDFVGPMSGVECRPTQTTSLQSEQVLGARLQDTRKANPTRCCARLSLVMTAVSLALQTKLVSKEQNQEASGYRFNCSQRCV